MDTTMYVLPGSFSPPTYGHVHLAERAAKRCPELTIVCSVNPDKAEIMFTPDEAKALFLSYSLPDNVSVITLQELLDLKVDPERLVMIRGIRNEDDLEYEKNTLWYNKTKFGVDNYFFICTHQAYSHISSTAARKAAADLDFERLAEIVSPAVVTALLEKIHGWKNLFMVVGRPGCGKSTVLKAIEQADPRNIYIDTDKFSRALAPIIIDHFGTDADLLDLAANHDEELSAVVKGRWFELLRENLLGHVGKSANIFLEVPYGLRKTKSIFRYLGGKILHIGCEDSINRQRNRTRGTAQYQVFFCQVPGLMESRLIAKNSNLDLTEIDTSGTEADSVAKAKSLSNKLNADLERSVP